MGLIYKQSSRTTIISYLGVVIGYLNVLWLFPTMLSAEQIGLLRLLPSIALMVLPLTQLGLSQGVLKFYPEYASSEAGSNELFSVMLLGNLVGFGITLVLAKVFESHIISFFAAKSALANDFIHVAVVLVLVLSYQTIFEAFSRSVLKIIFPGLIKDIITRLLYTLLVLAFFLNFINFPQLVNSLIAIYTATLVLLVAYVLKRTSMKLVLKFQVITKQEIKKIAHYSLFTLLGASGTYIMLNIDQVMISNLLGLESNGIYTTAFYIAIVIEMPRRAIANIATPLVSKMFTEQRVDEINQLYKQVSINQLLVGSLLLIGILVNLRNVFGLMPNSEIYQAGMYVVYIIGIAKIIDMTFGMNSEIILMSDFYKYNVLFTTILAVLAIVSNWILIQIYGIEGAALATALTLIIFNLIKMIFLKIKLNLWPFKWQHLLLIVIITSTYVIITQLPFLDNFWLDILFRSVITTVIFIVPCLLLRISPELNRVIKQITGISL